MALPNWTIGNLVKSKDPDGTAHASFDLFDGGVKQGTLYAKIDNNRDIEFRFVQSPPGAGVTLIDGITAFIEGQ